MENIYKIPREVSLGGENGIRKIYLGKNHPLTIQTMWKDGITDVTEDSPKLESILREINNLKSLGCDIVRFAVPDMESAHGLCVIQKHTDVPLVADIHFDY
ncbi:MAG: flavodoxin-dependent (E)-4-hydroxy-3-methylbut-2-enyl-diphosphate synthase, partial [Spirochaetia bacterium]|nr:flavodoxin-dependent (E)-4-hydroxy-3-methylbut-2-enyl-diphosphate synthase [Spirochaetia bacterium]